MDVQDTANAFMITSENNANPLYNRLRRDGETGRWAIDEMGTDAATGEYVVVVTGEPDYPTIAAAFIGLMTRSYVR